MLIASQNLVNYGIPVPENTIFRINLAWTNTLDELNSELGLNPFPFLIFTCPIYRHLPKRPLN